MSRYNGFWDATNEDIGNVPYKGFIKQEYLQSIREADFTVYTIPVSLEYRPDLISYIFYDDPHKAYLLVYANDISDSPEGFYVDREIKVPTTY